VLSLDKPYRTCYCGGAINQWRTDMERLKQLNFNTNDIETEQLLDMFQDDEQAQTEHVNILDFCLDLEANELIDDEKFNFMEI
jgi:hypothetical protein